MYIHEKSFNFFFSNKNVKKVGRIFNFQEKVKKRNKAQKDLKTPDMLKKIVNEVHQEGVVGEEKLIKVIALKISLRLVKGCSATSGNILISDDSGLGKDWITKRVCDVMLEAEKTYFHRTDLSEKVLNYWELKDDDKNTLTWDGKVIWLEDPIEKLIKSQAFKVRTSGGNAITVLKDQVPFTVIVKGKPIFIVTSMKTSLDVENERRWDMVRLDSSKGQTRAISQWTAEKNAGLLEYHPDLEFRDTLQNLKQYEVVIPFSERVLNGNEYKNARTLNTKLFDYIKASAVLHQHDRAKIDDKLIATYEDYDNAVMMWEKMGTKFGAILNTTEEKLLKYLKKMGEPTKIKQIIDKTRGITKDWIYRHKDDLVERGLINIKMDFDADSNKEIEHLELGVNLTFKLNKNIRRD